MKPFADIVVSSPDNEIQLVVEVKNRKGATDEWAAKMRRNLVTHGIIPASKFFLLVLPEYLYLWRNNVGPNLVPPDYKISSKEALKGYLEDMNLDELSEQSLELLIGSWLKNLTSSRVSKELQPELRWLFESGLYEKIKGGSVLTETAA